VDHAGHQRRSAIQGESQARTARSARGQDGPSGIAASRGPPLSAAGYRPRACSIPRRAFQEYDADYRASKQAKIEQAAMAADPAQA
jgi:hypothetical protein